MYANEYNSVDTMNVFLIKQIISNFIVFEGIDGSGKSTQLQLLEKHIQNVMLHAKEDSSKAFETFEGDFQAENTVYTHEEVPFAYSRENPSTIRTFFTAEPTNLQTGQFLRSILKGEVEAHPTTVVHLFAADRAEHLFGKGGIIERCNNNELCVCDRYLFSNLAYQGVTCGAELPAKLNDSFPLPELVIYFDIKPEDSLKRAQSRGEAEIYEKLDFLEKTHAEYEKVFQHYEDMIDKEMTTMKIVRIDASQNQDIIAEIVWRYIEPIAKSLIKS